MHGVVDVKRDVNCPTGFAYLTPKGLDLIRSCVLDIWGGRGGGGKELI
jgi:hypothetical protein